MPAKRKIAVKSNLCPTCGKEAGFIIRNDRKNPIKRARKFCSISCSMKFRHKDNIIFISCPTCKKEFRKYAKDGVARKHCSMKCYDQQRSVNLPKYEYPKKDKKNYKIKKIDGKQILYHRWIMEKHLGRKLTRSEVIHHIDGDPHNNNIENLQLLTQSDHMKLEISQLKRV